MKRQLFILLLAISSVYVQGITITHGPYLCDMTTDGVTVVWTTDLQGPAWVETENTVTAEKADYYEVVAGNIVAIATLHRVRINNLKPGTKYNYRIFTKEIGLDLATLSVNYGETVASNDFSHNPLSFTTFSKDKKDISFVVLNDIHSRTDFMKELCNEVDFKALDFVCFNGDMWEWLLDENMIFDGCMDAAVEMFASEIPIVFNRGNHETRGPYAIPLINYFPTVNGTFYYQFGIGDVCFLVLDGGEDKEDSHPEYFNLAAFDSYREEESRWLEQNVVCPEFQNAKARIVFLHIPPMVSTGHGSLHLQKTLIPILNHAKIDVILSGHTHSYIYREADATSNFPTVVNSNKTYMLCTIKDGQIRVEMKGQNPLANHTHEFQIKNRK
ncbi:MAG: metallophosphoesterase [Bacteroidales bacterium]|jgi:Icc-related predicted phosphoesterase|nr:metallophosphoesterase [Bacteroidales bacterium]